MHAITDWLGGLSGPVIYAVVAALVFCEDAIFVGFVLPGETAVVLGGVLASQGKVNVWLLCLVVVFAAIAGDSVGYEIGHRFGPSILNVRPLRRHHARVLKAQDLIRRRGPEAVFLGRFIAFFRAMMPALAGISRMPYRRFLLFNALGGLVWGVGFTLLGYFAGNAYSRIEAQVGRAVAIAVAAVVVVGLIVWHFRRRRRADETEAEPKPGAASRDEAESPADPDDEPAQADPAQRGDTHTGD
jgi:membrane protein DedA with SNARE-associated domain